MKKTLIATTIAASAMTPIASQAVDLETKQAGVATTGVLAGALIGGPVGMLAAFAGTIYVSEQMENNHEAAELEKKWQAQQAEVSKLTRQLHAAHTTIDDFETIDLDQLELQVMFKTGDDELTLPTQKALDKLAKFLVKNPELTVELDGYADPRGTDEYNNVLSEYRARSVKTALTRAGVNPGRIQSEAHGSKLIHATPGDLESYALDRRVEIHIRNESEQTSVAQAH